MTDIEDKRVLTKERIELHFYDEVYRIYLVFMITSREDFKKFLVDHDLKLSIIEDLNLATASGYCIKLDSETTNGSGNNFFVVWAQEKHLSCLVHELSHLAMLTFDEKGIPLRIDNQETFAYYIEHWVKRITEAWKVPRSPKVKSSKDNKEKSDVK